MSVEKRTVIRILLLIARICSDDRDITEELKSLDLHIRHGGLKGEHH